MSNELVSDLTEIFPPVEIALPSRGIFYPEGILGPKTDPLRIRVGTLGIMDEFKYRDPFMIVHGRAIDHLIGHLCGDQILMPGEMCEIDIETILIASRLASYGPDLRIKHTCGSTVKDGDSEKICGHLTTVAIDLHEHILRYGPIEDESKFEVSLPRVGQTVYLKPTPYRTTIEVMRNVMTHKKRLDELQEQDQFVVSPEDFKKYEEVINLRADLQIRTILDCINAVKTRSGKVIWNYENPEHIGEWIFQLPKSDHDVIYRQISKITDDFRKISLIRYACAACGKENEFNLQMNAEILFLVDSEESTTSMISSVLPEKNKKSFRTPSRISPKSRSRTAAE
jgi:hypothetical protein